jgi:putative transposase
MWDFSQALLASFEETPAAWCVLPNHYHLLIRTGDIKQTVNQLGRLYGRTSYRWNGEEEARGRKVWHSVSDRMISSSEHFRATVNYIHHNPVKHGNAATWHDWPFSSAEDFLESQGREEAASIWRSYPVLDYGKGWDD